jgi:hypothetical protein
MDILENGDLKLHRTAVAQVVAFLLQAVRTEPPPQPGMTKLKSLVFEKSNTMTFLQKFYSQIASAMIP